MKTKIFVTLLVGFLMFCLAAPSIAAVGAKLPITITQSSGGKITPAGKAGIFPVSQGTNQTFTLKPNKGHHVSSVTVDGAQIYDGITPPADPNLTQSGTSSVWKYKFVNVTDPHSITATFAKNIYTLTVNFSGTGSVDSTPEGVSGMICTDTSCAGTFEYGERIVLTATPGEDLVAGKWKGCKSSKSNPTQCTIKAIKSNITVSTSFVMGNPIAADYFPLAVGNEWDYLADELYPIVLEATSESTENGVPVTELQFSNGGGTFWSIYASNSSGIKFHRMYYPDLAATADFTPHIALTGSEIKLNETRRTSGSVMLDISGYGTYPFSFASTSLCQVGEAVAIPSGDVETIRCRATLHIWGSVAGQKLDSEETDVYWLAKHIGIVKYTMMEGTPDESTAVLTGVILASQMEGGYEIIYDRISVPVTPVLETPISGSGAQMAPEQ